jgi:hypothetical protein
MMEQFRKGLQLPEVPGRLHGGILPHAGWQFSGKTAFSALLALQHAVRPRLLFLFGMHLPARSPNYVFIDEGFRTPLGPVEAHREAARRLAEGFDFVVEHASSCRPDNTIELQLPFIKALFPEARVVAAGIAPGDAAVALGERAVQVAGELGEPACFLGSTDLTHYGPGYGFTPRGTGPAAVGWVRGENDRRIIDRFLSLRPEEVILEALHHRNACCPGAAAAALAAGRRSGADRGHLVHYCTSYDLAPDSSFVGYAGVVF